MDASKVESLEVMVRCLSFKGKSYLKGHVITSDNPHFQPLCENGNVSADSGDKPHLLAKMVAESEAPKPKAPAKKKAVASKAPANKAATRKAPAKEDTDKE